MGNIDEFAKASSDSMTTTKEAAKPLAEMAEAVSSATQYVPTFSADVRKVVYIVCVVLSIVGGAFAVIAASAGAPTWVTLVSAIVYMVGGALGSSFGVRYVGQSA